VVATAVATTPSFSSAVASVDREAATAATTEGKGERPVRGVREECGLMGFECRCDDVFCGVHRY
jgi:hypothetical protein